MNENMVTQITKLAQDTNHIIIATANAYGLPHIALAGSFHFTSQDRIKIKEWLCPGTIANLGVNKFISIVIWNVEGDTGFQLLGELHKIEELSILDGYLPDEVEAFMVPQSEHELHIQIKKVMKIKRSPHTDEEL